MKNLKFFLSVLFALNIVSAYEFGATEENGSVKLFLKDEGWSGQNFAYLCSDDGCLPAALENGYWVRTTTGQDGDVISFGAKIDNAPNAQVIFENEEVTVGPVLPPPPPQPSFSVQLDYVYVGAVIHASEGLVECNESTLGVTLLAGLGYIPVDGATLPYLCVKTWTGGVTTYHWVTTAITSN